MSASGIRPSREELRARIRSFPYWHYPFDLGDGVVVEPTHGWPDAIREMRDFIWPVLVGFYGGDLRGLRVLDVGCNAGFWALQAHETGAAYVLGVDASSEAIAQATLVRDALQISPDAVEYRQLDIYDLSRERVGEFDLCFVFRVLHHLAHPLLALERVRDVCRAWLAIDICFSNWAEPVFELHRYDPKEPFCGVGRGLELHPSLSALELMLVENGFTNVRVVPPSAPLNDRQYYEGKRAFVTAQALDASRA